MKELHKRLEVYRDVWVAHPDVTHRQPTRTKDEGKPAVYKMKTRDPLEFESDLLQIKELIQSVINKMNSMGLSLTKHEP